MAKRPRSCRSGCCSCHCFEIVAMKYSITAHGDARSAEWAMSLTWEYLGGSVECPASFHLRDVSIWGGSPSKRTPSAPRSRIHTRFYYHTNKICRQRRICKENKIKVSFKTQKFSRSISNHFLGKYGFTIIRR